VQIWNAAKGLDWQALDLLVEVYGCSEPEILIAELLALREFMEKKNG
jgi:hypothetical protein